MTDVLYLVRVILVTAAVVTSTVTFADDPPSAVGAVLKLLKGGNVPEKNLGTIIKMVSERGNEHDLAFLLDQVLHSEKLSVGTRIKMLEGLAGAATTRKLIPAGELASIAGLIAPESGPADRRLQLAAIRLAGLWKVQTAVDALHRLAVAPKSSVELRQASLEALSRLGPAATEKTLGILLEPSQPFEIRGLAVAALVQSDSSRAAAIAAEILKSAGGRDDPNPIVDAFLARQGGSDKLATALEKTPPSSDAAKLCLRRMYAAGRSDAGLQAVLGKLAGIETNPRPLSKDQTAALIAEAQRLGDAGRGEQVFRRSDLSCMKCHAVSKAGGQVGPDLSAIGSSSPVEYLVTSIFDPDQAIKEAYISKTIITTNGQTYSGIVADRSDTELKLKNSDGRELSIPLADIDEEIEGKSLMPKGLPSLMTKAEILDLVTFLSMLGKPGEYAIRSTARMQRWRVYADSSTLGTEIPDTNSFKVNILDSDRWVPVYATTGGNLPLADCANLAKLPVVYLLGEVDVVEAGPVELRLDSQDGILAWVDGNEHPDLGTPAELTAGRHSIVLRVDTANRKSPVLKLELEKPADSSAQFNVVDGQ